MEGGEWKVESGKWRVESGEWKRENGKSTAYLGDFAAPRECISLECSSIFAAGLVVAE